MHWIFPHTNRFPVFLLALSMAAAPGPMFDAVTNKAEAGDGEDSCTAENGDVNADGAVDVSDPIATLGHLFLGKPRNLPALCPAHTALAPV